MQEFKQITLLLISLFILGSCAVNPVTGKKEIMLMSEAQEIALGQNADPSVVGQYGLYNDDKLQKFISEKGKQMGAISHRAQLEYSFKIVDSPVVNAFALPGGYVYFTRGILAHFNNEAEFAGVLGHEIGHVTARHGARQQTRAQLGQVLLVGGMIASPAFAQFGQEAMQGLGLLFLKFGRDDESQSDRLGVEYSTKIGYDSHEMAGFFETLHRLGENSGGSEIPSFMSTHPDPLDRYNTVDALSDEWQQTDNKGPYKVGRDEYLSLVEGLVYGEDPRQGYVYEGSFYHPELKFKFPIPAGWKHLNAPTQVQMAPEDGKALMIFTLSGQKELKAAADEIISNYKLTVKENKNITVNGMPAIGLFSQQITQDETTGEKTVGSEILTYCINYNNTIYVFHGVSSPTDFKNYGVAFSETMNGFNKVTSSARLNVEPERIRVKVVPQSMNFQKAMTYFKMPEARLDELSIINGMKSTEYLPKGTKVKVIGK